MNEMQIFKNSELGEIGVISINGREYFPATSCAKILGYADPYDAIKRHTRGSVKHRVPTYNQHGAEVVQEMKFIPESDLYRLITHSKLPAAEKFERWVFDEVLPTIRKHGAYAPNMSEVISQTVKATMNEVIRELIPAIMSARPSQPTVSFTVGEHSLSSSIPNKRHRRKKPLGIIERLDEQIRDEIDDMLLSRQFTYDEIANHLVSEYSISISRGSVGRYAANFYDGFCN